MVAECKVQASKVWVWQIGRKVQARCKQGASKVEGTGGRSVAVQVCNVHAPFSQALGLFDSFDCLRWMRLTD